MVVVVIGVVVIGQIVEGVLFIVIFVIFGVLEVLVMVCIVDLVCGLMGFVLGIVICVGVGGGEEMVNVVDLRIGDIVLVWFGECILVDVIVFVGGSEVDQVIVIGELLFVDKLIGDQVFVGIVNGIGVLWIWVDWFVWDFVVVCIVILVEQVSQIKVCIQLFIEKVE